MIQGQLYTILALLPQTPKNMPLLNLVQISWQIDFLLGVIFILSNPCQNFKITNKYLSAICLHQDLTKQNKCCQHLLYLITPEIVIEQLIFVLKGVAYMIIWEMFHGGIYLKLVFLLVNYMSEFRFELMHNPSS